MILQAGANGNVFAYNSSTNARDQNGSQDEDLVCHGNYPYLNLFESNVCEAPSVDGSHGENGPFNTYFRNRSTASGFNVTSYNLGGLVLNNSDQNFIGNEGSSSINGSGHLESFNSWNSDSGPLTESFAYDSLPAFLSSNEFGAIGYGYFGMLANNPAADRFVSGYNTLGICGDNNISLQEHMEAQVSYSISNERLILKYSGQSLYLSQMRILSLDGKLLFESDVFETIGEHQFEIGRLQTGVYIVQLQQLGQWKSFKILVHE
jgi:hypothetical protein